MTGFAFVPFLLLRNTESIDSAPNPFSNFAMSFANILNFISSDYGALEAFEDSAAVRTLRALYIIIITVLFLNILIAMLNLKIKTADKNAANLYHLQMASLQVEIELGLLSASERHRRDWFPEWFSYSMTETETRVWQDYAEKNKLKWDEDNDFDETKEDAPPVSRPPPPADDWAAATTSQLPPASFTNDVDEVDDLYYDEEEEPLWPSESTLQSQTQTQPQPSYPSNPSPFQPSTSSATATASATASSCASTTAAAPSSPSVPAKTETTPTCTVCGAPGKRCTGCGKVAYCGKEHQKADWKAHRSVCKKG
jgi:hypothetical protein